MLSTLKKINKFEFKHVVKEINTINDELLESLLYSQYAHEGIHGFEYIHNKNQSKIHVFAPVFEKIEYGKEIERKNWFINDTINFHCYDISLINPSFLPLKILPINMINELANIQIENTSLFFQILFQKRTDNWRNVFLEQYKSFLKGNNIPSENVLARTIQENIIVSLEKLSNNYKYRNKIEEIESKILDLGYRTEIRLIIHSDELSSVKKVESKIEKILSKIYFFNELQLVKVKKSTQFINDIIHRNFSFKSKYQILSANEIKSLINSNSTIVSEVKPTIDTTIVEKSQLSNLIKLLPQPIKKDREIDNLLPKKISNSLKRVGIVKNQEISITKFEQGNTLQKVTFKIPENVNYSDIERNLKNIKATLGIEALSIEQGDEPETVSFLIPATEREIVYIRELLENKDFIQFANDSILPIIVGVDVLGNPIYDDLARIKHLLIAGATGSGKSVFINVIIITLILMRKPSELMLYLIDPKVVEFSQYKGFPHVQEVVTNMSRAKNLLQSLVNEMNKRYEFLANKGYKDLQGYNKKNKDKIPYIVCIVDEFSDLIMTAPSDVETFVILLTQKARAAGIHLIIATQRPEVNVLTGLIKANLPSKISLRLDNVNDYKTVFGKGIPYQLLGQGDGVLRLEGQIKEFERFQSPVVTLDQEEETEIYHKMKQIYKDEKVDGIEIVEIKEELPIEKLKRIIANSGETRISKLREEMGIRMNDVKDLMQELIGEGWLEEPKNKRSGYTLIASEEILNEWKN